MRGRGGRERGNGAAAKEERVGSLRTVQPAFSPAFHCLVASCRELEDARKERDEARALASLSFDGPPLPPLRPASASGSGASGDKSPALPGSPLAGIDSTQTEM